MGTREGGHQCEKHHTVHARTHSEQLIAVVAFDDQVGHDESDEETSSQLEAAHIRKHPNDCCEQSHQRKDGKTLSDVVAKSFLAHRSEMKREEKSIAQT